MDMIELWSGGTRAIIDPMGAWLTNLSDDNGDILFPKRRLAAPDGSSKTRGGCHVCLPNFGPGGDSGLAQHGFGRVLPWQPADQAANSVVLTLTGGEDGYQALVSRLTYQLADRSLRVTLQLTNTGQAPLRVAPGFHPYFALRDGEDQVKLDGAVVELAALTGTEFQTGTHKQLHTAHRTIAIQSANLDIWAVWTDQLAAYVCVEPTAGGYAFTRSAVASELLTNHNPHTYACTISW